MIVRYAAKLWHHLLTMLAKARIINYESRIVIYSFIILATVIMIVNYDRTVITIINYDHKTFIVRARDDKVRCNFKFKF